MQFTPTEEELKAARQELASQATRTAVAEVKAVAEAAGEHVIRVQSVAIAAPDGMLPLPRVRFPAMIAAAPAASPIPALPGDAAVSVTVAVQVRIDR